MLHGNLQMSKIFQSYAAITDLLKNHTYYRHITNGHRIYYRLFQYSCNLYDFLFFAPKNWQQSFSVPLKSHSQHFQVMLVTFFFSSQESAFCTPLHFNIFQLFAATTLSANTWQIYQINFNLQDAEKKQSHVNILQPTEHLSKQPFQFYWPSGAPRSHICTSFLLCFILFHSISCNIVAIPTFW